RKAPGGNQLRAAVFSPDGRRIAVSFRDSTAVDVLDGEDLHLLYRPDVAGVDNGNILSVAWGAHGSLYAGGRWNVHDICKIRRWADGGRGGYRDLPVGGDTIMDIRPLPDGGVVVGSADPALTLIDAAGRTTRQRLAEIADMRNKLRGNFRVSSDGRKVYFGLAYGGQSPALFDLGRRQLTRNPETTAGLHAATESPDIRDWAGTTHPTLNGSPLALEAYEISRAVAIAPDRRSFLLGADWYLRRFDTRGRLMWKQPVPGVAWGVNLSGDGKLAVAAFGDGTIRWYRYSDGRLLLSLFPHKDGKRWIAWTPGGYYDASSGAEDLIGWHLNRGKDRAAAFYPVGKFRSRFYRPDIVARVLDAGSEAEAIRLADAARGRSTQRVDLARMVPPDLRVLAPSSGSSFSGGSVTIRYRASSPSGEPVTRVFALVDGRPVSRGRGVKIVRKATDANSLTVPLPAKDVTVALFAENRFATSDPVLLHLHYAGRAAGGGAKRETAAFVIKPKLYVLAVGISHYDDKRLKLGLPAKDAKDFSAAVLAQKGKLYRDVVVKTLIDGQATGDNILDGLDWLTRETTSKDVAMLFLAGHGVDDNTGDYYFLPSDVNTRRLRRTGIPFYEIKKTMESLAGKALFFVDSCHSGDVMGKRRGVADINAVVNELSSAETGAVVFAASTGNQYSLEDDRWGNGAFTKALVEGLRGKADFRHLGRITVNMLDLYISERVKELTGGRQTPTTTKPSTIPDFPVAVVR
ncbi:MAG: hypothetical protein D6811_02860, partial [Alphaproteobacteria bacterium]